MSVNYYEQELNMCDLLEHRGVKRDLDELQREVEGALESHDGDAVFWMGEWELEPGSVDALGYLFAALRSMKGEVR